LDSRVQSIQVLQKVLRADKHCCWAEQRIICTKKLWVKHIFKMLCEHLPRSADGAWHQLALPRRGYYFRTVLCTHHDAAVSELVFVSCNAKMEEPKSLQKLSCLKFDFVRGHRLVSHDMVIVTARPPVARDEILGFCKAARNYKTL
jgi:hypothetical protein